MAVTKGRVLGRNSHAIKNSPIWSPARIETIEGVVAVPTVVEFDIVSREGQFTDTTIANYNFRGQGSSIGRYLLNEGSKFLNNYFKGELTTQFDGITPKTLSFDIIYRIDNDFPAILMLDNIKKLQSLCYPRNSIGLNPPLCNLYVANLYALEVYVQQVLVSWHNQWDFTSGIPMGCDISMSVLMHQYPTREEILQGAGFNSGPFLGRGYSGTPDSGVPKLANVVEALRTGRTIGGGV